MQSRPIASSLAAHRDKLLWAFLGMLVVAQLAVFWMVCQQQVRKAEVRDATIKVQRVALADCMHRGTLSTCAVRHDMNSSVPADFVFR